MSKKVNKVIYGGQTIVDMTDATAGASDILLGETAYLTDGTKATGTLPPVQESGFMMSNPDNELVLDWYGTQAECPYSVVLENGVYYLETVGENPYTISIDKGEYVLNFTFTT